MLRQLQRECYHQTHSDGCVGGAGLFPPLLRSARLTHLSSPGPPSVSLPSWRFSPFRCLTVNSNPSCFGNVIQAEAPAAVGGGGRHSGVGGGGGERNNNIFFSTVSSTAFSTRVPRRASCHIPVPAAAAAAATADIHQHRRRRRCRQPIAASPLVSHQS